LNAHNVFRIPLDWFFDDTIVFFENVVCCSRLLNKRSAELISNSPTNFNDPTEF
jgi:hypothetical protein